MLVNSRYFITLTPYTINGKSMFLFWCQVDGLSWTVALKWYFFPISFLSKLWISLWLSFWTEYVNHFGDAVPVITTDYYLFYYFQLSAYFILLLLLLFKTYQFYKLSLKHLFIYKYGFLSFFLWSLNQTLHLKLQPNLWCHHIRVRLGNGWRMCNVVV